MSKRFQAYSDNIYRSHLPKRTAGDFGPGWRTDCKSVRCDRTGTVTFRLFCHPSFSQARHLKNETINSGRLWTTFSCVRLSIQYQYKINNELIDKIVTNRRLCWCPEAALQFSSVSIFAVPSSILWASNRWIQPPINSNLPLLQQLLHLSIESASALSFPTQDSGSERLTTEPYLWTAFRRV